MKQYRRLLGHLRPYLWPHGVLAVVAMLGFSGVESSIPFLAKFTFDQVFTQQHREALPLAVVGVLVLAVLRGGLDFASEYLTDWIGQRVVTDLRNELTSHMQRLDLAFFNRQRAGQIVSRVTTDVSLVRGTVTDALTSLFEDITRLIGLVAVAVYMDWVLALLAVVLFPVAGLPLRYFSKQLRQTGRGMQEGIGRLNAMLHENVQGNRVVKAFGQERSEQERFHEHNLRLFRLYMRQSLLRAVPITELLAGIAVAGIIYYGGASKSTLADLIPRFYDPTEGRITVDGVDLRDLTLASLRAQIAVVTQFTFLFNDSVRTNIAYGDPDRSTEEIIAAARAANAHDFILELPRGYDTHIGDLGVRLSGGQRQRLAIARALLKNAPILILDEATSALDTESEGLVQEALERLMANRTTLVVAHRLSTVRRADRIVVLVRGEIVESGTHDELLARGAEYRKLYELQFRDVEALEGGTEAGGERVPARKAAR